MNYFPYMLDFKNANLYNMPYSMSYGFQCPFLDVNQLTLSQYHYNPSVYQLNNGLIQNFQEQIPPNELSKQILCNTNSSSKQLEVQITEQIKNISDKEKKEKKVFKQKEGRNMISNLFRQALKSMLNEKDKTIEIIEKIASKYNIQINPKEFIEIIAKKLKNLKNYVRIGQIQAFLKGKDSEKSKQHAKVLRILVHRFLRQQVIPCLCNNPKVQNANRISHILQRRKFQEILSL